MNIDDPKLTAYALGELSEEERHDIEAQLRDDPAARAFVEETAAFSRLLSKEFHAEMPPTELDTDQRSAVLDQARNEKIAWFTPRGIAWATGIAALAAALAVAPTLPWFQNHVSEPKLARRDLDKAAPAVAAVAAQTPNAAATPKPSEPVALAKADETVALAKPVMMAKPVAPNSDALTASVAPQGAPIARTSDNPQTRLALSPPPPPGADMATVSSPSAPAKTVQNETVAVSGGTVSASVTTPKTGLSREQYTKIGAFTRGWKKRSVRGNGSSVKDSDLSNSSAGFKSIGYDGSLRRNSAPGNTESYAALDENPFLDVAQNPLSTFSIDVDTASYANVRRFLNSGQRPPAGAVRIEELINYFPYAYPQPKGDDPFSVNVETAQCPWQPEHRLVRIGLKGREIANADRPASNLVFLLDVSGSMDEENKLPLLKKSMRLLVEKLGENDKIAIVVYAGSTGIALPSTRGDQKERIFQALDSLKAGGSTNGAGGIQLAYKTATESFIPDGTNRVILATDGDFNVGISSESELVKLIEEQRKSGVFLTVLGFGEGNLKDAMMRKLASHGNGNYAYIDSLKEGRKVLVETMGGTLVTIAKDVKIQVEFNPRKVGTYRLVGYESRMLAKEDFNNDKKDAGEIGAGHTVTALYEIIPAGSKAAGSVDPLKYQPEKSATPTTATAAPVTNELLTVKLRYKKPTEETSKLIEQPVTDSESAIQQCSPDFMFAAAVAEFGMLLRGSSQAGSATWATAHDLATESKGRDEGGYRAEFLQLLEKAKGPGADR